jgi:hypothetical protein
MSCRSGNRDCILCIDCMLNANQLQDNNYQYFMSSLHKKNVLVLQSKTSLTAGKDNYFQELRRSKTPKMRSISSGDSNGITTLPFPFSFILKLTLAENILFRCSES